MKPIPIRIERIAEESTHWPWVQCAGIDESTVLEEGSAIVTGESRNTRGVKDFDSGSRDFRAMLFDAVMPRTPGASEGRR